MIRNRDSVDKVEWGRGNLSWLLFDSNSLSIKLEEIGPGNGSETHFHSKSVQFFFILKGRAEFTLGNHVFLLKENDGFEVPRGQKHRIENKGSQELFFLLASSPKVKEEDIFRG